ncbi:MULTISPECIES: RES family NAD+ phosphorylase [unclassified Mesorhizobium]|uniref:RES family NAD+ phosphorylase n=1 Tax=unclassified Mesorhizobium TaxID=325217 RepID=UPI000FC9D4EF|nr:MULTISPECIES: RES family NAD+ phosphorylase [unclassified Mesorhizobium]RUZ82785.1 RES domain-containing protein [Mesorhizobium sp. M7A.F.Ca.US.003.02.2.1]QKC83493.1 RES domain-containing protein [Mesorhizobium sp. NZP2077]QKD17007.1 RES family NAD+ phosphorylase [Mesorhizobium sp. NZP2077]RUY93915.1 RES domain-containing protein [Mesorhizobium sp. M7A.F.Ca.CA.001.12.2.1]RUZ25244.1 RES domain-containing protein [Mesorhizobium sp. M7A.F.Ca.US.007.01.2.1]
MSKRRCCPECFDDRGLREQIFPFLGPEHGTCSFCGTPDVDLLEPLALAPFFGLVVNVYERSENGKSLAEWMKGDWQLFSHPAMDVAHAKELLAEILDDGEIVRASFVPSPSYKSEGLVQWETLRDEMMYRNRWFLDMSLDTDRLRQLLDHLPAADLPRKWFRARIRAGDEIYEIDKMGAPPKRLASHGRANPAGIPYLYLGSMPETAAAEIRPHTGEVACVADFTIPEIQAVDLRNPRKLVSPFILEDAGAIGQLRADLPFLERLGEELTRPVLPSGAAIDYIPSQYLCEFIKKSGFDGVVYRSSVSDGINLALFDPTKAQGGGVSIYNVDRVSVQVSQAVEPGAGRRTRSGDG